MELLGIWCIMEIQEKPGKKGVQEMNREKMQSSIDKKVFKHTAVKTKKINIIPKVMRGGTRL